MLTNLRDRRGPAWFFTGQAGCYCCPTTSGVYVVFYGLKQSPVDYIRDVDKYEIDTWTSKGDGTAPKRSNLGAASISQIAYLFGGASSVSPFSLVETQSYIQSTDTFATKADMPANRVKMTSIPVDGKAYSFCGSDLSGTRYRSSYQYTVSSDSWATKTDSPTPARDECGGFELSLKGYVCGGVDAVGNILKDNDQYDPAGDSWTGKADIDTTGTDERRAVSSFPIDGKGYLAHGATTGPVLLNNVAEYDPTADGWTLYTSSTTARRAVMGTSIGATSPGYTTGGLAVGVGTTASLKHDEFTPTSWTSRADTPAPARHDGIAAESA